jgi:hypothetical protein
METRTEAPEVVGSLATLSQFFDDNTPATRRRLRSTIENQGVHINEEFLEEAQGVIKARVGSQGGLPGPFRQSMTASAAVSLFPVPPRLKPDHILLPPFCADA